MNQSLPERPNLEQLKRQAKDLLKAVRAGDHEARKRANAVKASLDAFSLHDAQLTLAREYGLSSWAKLKLRVETLTEAAVEARLIVANVRGDTSALNALLEENGALAPRSIFGAAAFGDLKAAENLVAENSSVATTPGGPVKWPPVLYLCFGRTGGSDETRAAIAEVLLDQGANPNSSYVDPRWPDSALTALYGATGVNNFPKLARALLRGGANPNDGESRYHAAEHYHRESLEVLDEFGADWSANDPTWNNTPLYFLLGYQHPPQQARDGIRWLLEHKADPNVLCYRDKQSESPLHAAIHNSWDLATIELLLDHGADPLLKRKDGRTPLALAIGMGRTDVAELLRRRGAVETLSIVDQFLGACMQAEGSRARGLLAENPDLFSRLSDHEQKIVSLAAQRGAADAIELMAEIGFDVNVQDSDGGATPLHWAAWQGQAAAAKALLRSGAVRDVLDSRFNAPPVGWCAHGSLHANNPRGDYPATMTALLEAGAKVPPNLEASPGVMRVVAQFTR